MRVSIVDVGDYFSSLTDIRLLLSHINTRCPLPAKLTHKLLLHFTTSFPLWH